MGIWDFLGIRKRRKAEQKHFTVERPPEEEEYLQAWYCAGKHLESMFQRVNQLFEEESKRFFWLRTDVISPTFDSMNFRYKNRVFSVLADPIVSRLVSDMQMKQHEHGYGILAKTVHESMTTEWAKQLQIEVCEENDMIPCLFSVSIDKMMPLEKGWNLRNTETGEPVNPEEAAGDTPRPVSEWELMNWGISIVMNDLKEKGIHILSFTDAPGIMPQLWFENEDGERCWVQVLVNGMGEVVDLSGTGAGEYRGYVAKVGIKPNDGEAVLYRSRPGDISFTGLDEVV